MSPCFERIVAAFATVASVYGFLYWLVPDMPLSIRVIFASPMALLMLAAIVWPERRGAVWPSNRPSNWRVLWFQRYVIAVYVYDLSYANLIVYSLYFPVPSYLRFRYEYPIAILLLDGNLVAGFLAMIRHHVRSLPPKGRVTKLSS